MLNSTRNSVSNQWHDRDLRNLPNLHNDVVEAKVAPRTSTCFFHNIHNIVKENRHNHNRSINNNRI
jgi:hypothetical protein